MKHSYFLRFLLLLLISIFSASAFSDSEKHFELQPGDLIFFSLPCYWCGLIEKTTGSPYNHVAVVSTRLPENSKLGRWNVAMAVEPKVIETPLDIFWKVSKVPPVVMRLASPYSSRLGEKIAGQVMKFLGAPYDHDFSWGGPNYYCAEFISLLFFRAFDEKINLFPPRPMKFENFWEEWTAYFGHPPPQGLLGLSPADILSSRFLRKVQY